jgi:hypothetical protein
MSKVEALLESCRFSFLVDRYFKDQYPRLKARFGNDFLSELLEYFDMYVENTLPQFFTSQTHVMADGFHFAIFVDGFITGVCDVHDKWNQHCQKTKKSKTAKKMQKVS